MKTNAIIRICIYSILILLLLGILAVFLFGWNPFHGDGYTWEISDGQFTKVYDATIALEEPETWPVDDADLLKPTDKAFSKADGEVYTVTSQLNYRTSPSATATVLGLLRPGDIIKIDEVQNVTGVEWGRVTTTSIHGWVCMDYVEPENAIAEPTAASEDSISATTATEDFGPPIVGGTFFPADQLTKISIDWASGDVVIRRGNTKEINVVEDAPGNAKPMVCEVRDGRKLNIKFWEGKFNVGLGFGNMSSKDLIVTVPMDFDLRELEIDMASGNVKLEGMTIDEIELDCADVECVLEDCTVRSLDVDTASGDISFSGALDELDLDSASADFVGVFTNAPRSLDMDGMSGALDITLPEGCGFTAKIDGLSNSFHSDHPVQTVNGAYLYGDGRCRIDVDGMSGEVIIRKAAK